MKFIPKYITTDILADYGEHLTHEAYNEMVLLNSTQGDYNTKVLNQLFNTDEGIQIPYLDKKIKEVTDDQAAINEDMEQVVADMAALAGSLSKYSTILETRRMIQYATQDFVKTNKIKAGENVEVEVDALNNVIISATGGGGGDVTQEYVDEHDASILASAKDYTDDSIAEIPIPVVPTNISAFNNDVGYITGYTETDPVFSASPAAGITSQDITDWNNKSDFSGDYEDLTNKPNIPTNTSDLNNDSGFITSESDPVFSASPAAGITAQDISNWNNIKSGLEFKGYIRKPSSTINLTEYDPGLYYVTDGSQYAKYTSPSSGQTIRFSDYGIPMRGAYELVIVKNIADAEADEEFAFAYGLGTSSYNLNGYYIRFTCKPNTTPGFSINSFTSQAAVLNGFVNVASAQTITGVKTFSALPQSSVVPTNNNDFVNKAYVDSHSGLVNLLDGNATGSLRGVDTLDDADPDYPTYAIGQDAVALGTSTRAEGASSFAGGSGAWAESYNDFAFGSCAHASGGQSVAFGSGSTASGSGSFALGNGATASGSTAVSMGQGSTVAGSSSFGLGTSNTVNANAFASAAIGLSNTISGGQGSIALGYGNTSSSFGSVAEGLQTTASDSGAHAEGGHTTASGTYSHAEGQYTVASGTNAHAEGQYTEAGTMQHAEGYYNLVEQLPIIHMVGNGNSSARSNAYTLDQMGNGWFSGDVYVGSTSGTHKDTGSVKLAKETQLLPSIADAHWTDAAREFIFADKPVGTYLVHNGSISPQSDITSRTNMSFRASTATSSRWSVTAQWGIIYIIKPYNDAATDEIFGYALFANGQTEGTMEFRLQSITRLSSGYRVSFNNMMVTNNNSPIKKMIRLYNSSSTYDVDDLVLNTDGWFYRCTTAITTPESFNSSHWRNFNGYGIDKYIKELISQIPGGNIPLEAGSHSTSPGVKMISSSSAANTASGLHAVALGTGCSATQREATAIGYFNTAGGSSSFAIGDTVQASGSCAFASGLRTIALQDQFVHGKYNIQENSSTGIIHIVGNGTSVNARSNAHTLYNNGDAWFAGDVYVGSTSGTDKDSGSVKLAKESQLPNITSTTTDPGAGSTLAEGAIVLVYE